MQYHKTIKVSENLANQMQEICDKADSSTKKDGTEFDHDVLFENNFNMAIQVIGAGDEEPGWTQGVLFDTDGNEVGCTEVKDTFLGEYKVTLDGDDYIVNVEKQNYYKHELKITILSESETLEDALRSEHLDLSIVDEAISSGDCLGMVEYVKTENVTDITQACKDLGNDGTFFDEIDL